MSLGLHLSISRAHSLLCSFTLEWNHNNMHNNNHKKKNKNDEYRGDTKYPTIKTQKQMDAEDTTIRHALEQLGLARKQFVVS